LEQKGTADAVLATREILKDFGGTVLILYGDVPLLKRSTVEMLVKAHQAGKAPITILTAMLEDPMGYGRIIRSERGTIERIVEETDASSAERTIREINTGIYCVAAPLLFEALSSVDDKNVKKEYYLTDVVAYCVKKGIPVGWYETQDPELTLGINTRKDLAIAESRVRVALCNHWMLSGVTIIDPSHTYIDHDVDIGTDTRIEPNCHIRGKTVIGNECIIEPGSLITDSNVGHRVIIRASSIIEESRIQDESVVGPMAHLRPGSVLGKRVRVGNFVETKKTILGDGSKAAHLTYLGDADVGKGVTIGCGTITCNFDGLRKHKTVIEDGAFVGSDTQFIAPVRVGKNSYIGSGSTITRDVPPDSLAVSRVKQKNVKGWVAKKKGQDS
jgi:bifunctional UDP-N-acetylglucosamine pyrophosphorylase/glucosamine-1-phosphate N-acetyltransferase